MRGLVRRRTQEDEEESVFVTMTDMTISFLLIVMILLAFFATQLSSQDKEAREKVNPLEAYLVEASRQRKEILIELSKRLRQQFPELNGVISIQQDTLRFQGEGLFESESSELRSNRERNIIETMGQFLDEILVCYSLTDKASDSSSCENKSILVESVQIEGHTDSKGEDSVNFPLSAARAFTTLQTMVRVAPSLLTRLNWSKQPVMSIAGYGPMRPIDKNETVAGRSANRRIDLRIIMYAPSTVEEVEKIRRRLDALRAVREP